MHMKTINASLGPCLAALLALGCGPNKLPAPDESKPVTDAGQKPQSEKKDTPRPTVFTSDNGRYSVALPPAATSMKTEEKTKDSPLGKVFTTTLKAQLGNASLQVLSFAFPKELFKPADTPKRLNSIRDKLVSSLRGKLLEEKEVKLDGHLGRDLRIQPEKPGLLFRARIYLVQGRTYQIISLGPKTRVDSREVDEFLESFKLAGK